MASRRDPAMIRRSAWRCPMRFARRWRQSATSRETDGSAEFGVELLRPCSTRPDWRGVRAAKPPFRKRVGRHQRFRRYFFLPGAKLGCHAAAFWLGAAAMILIFSFLGFLTSRLPRCSPLAMSISLDLMLVGSWRLGPDVTIAGVCCAHQKK